ncbi:MAG: ABC transporter ATP-binding protein [Clostridia bacterium]|nr:ABC transporter ATP-binding protein [Clostridia bacterium]
MKKDSNKINVRPYTKQFYRGNCGYLALSLLEVTLTVLLNLVVSWLLQQITDLISGIDTGYSLGALLIITLASVIGIGISGLISFIASPKFITRGISQYKEYVFAEITKKNISAFSGENSSTYISALTNDIQAIEKGYLENITSMVSSCLFLIGGLILMLWYSPMLTLTAILLAFLPMIASLIAGDKMAIAEKAVSSKNETYTSTLKDSLSGFAVIKSFKAESQMTKILRDNIGGLAEAQCKKQKIGIIINTIGAMTSVIAQLGVFIIAAYLAFSGKGMTAGTAIVFVQLMNFVINPLAVIPTCIAERKAAVALIRKTASSLNTNIREETESDAKPLVDGIDIRDLSFGYESDKKVLKKINCRFELGKKYAIVGQSGCGKSTLLNLLMASYSDYEGEINYDDTELRDMNSSDLYELQSIIQQNVFVFNATIRDNITMFQSFPEEQINEAIRLSGLLTLIREKGEDYLCGENGSGLSGGEKQRISIARSLLKRSQVLLVDEATAALDAETAYQVASAILGLKDVTGIVVTHSLDEGLLKQYDQIITLKNGSIVETGTFDDLIAEKGYFYSLFTISQ